MDRRRIQHANDALAHGGGLNRVEEKNVNETTTERCYAADASGPYAFLACNCTACHELQGAVRVMAEARQAELRATRRPPGYHLTR